MYKAYQYLSIAFTVNLAYLSLHSSGIWSVTILVPQIEQFTSPLPFYLWPSTVYPPFLPPSHPLFFSFLSIFLCILFLFLTSTLPSSLPILTLQFLVHHSSDLFCTILEQTLHNTSSIMLQGQLWGRRNGGTVKTVAMYLHVWVATYIHVWEGWSLTSSPGLIFHICNETDEQTREK